MTAFVCLSGEDAPESNCDAIITQQNCLTCCNYVDILESYHGLRTLRRAALYPAELRVRSRFDIKLSRSNATALTYQWGKIQLLVVYVRNFIVQVKKLCR